MQSLLRPLRPTRNLADEVVDRIASEIRRGGLQPGTRLPTEAELVAAMGVSRTVVREAVAALKADGLVMTRQGLGAFVATDASRLAFRIASDGSEGPNAIYEMLRVLELRLAVETEAAALAAERGSAQQLAEIRDALRALDAAIAAHHSAVQEDFAFHRSIAEATGNPHFPDFLAFLGRHVIPRQVIRTNQSTKSEQLAYLSAIQKDHVGITEAIISRNAAAARKAMRLHLVQSVNRYRRFAASLVATEATGAHGASDGARKSSR